MTGVQTCALPISIPADVSSKGTPALKGEIVKLQAQNVAIQNNAVKLEARSKQQQKKIDSLMISTREMKSTLNALQLQMNEMKMKMGDKPDIIPSKSSDKAAPAKRGSKKSKKN